MATLTQTVGSENKESPTPDGVIASGDSPAEVQASPQKPTAEETASEAGSLVVVANGEKAEPDPLATDRKVLRKMGLSGRLVSRLLDGRKNKGFLNTRVTSSISLVFVANTMDELQRAQKRANDIGGDSNYDARARVAALSVVAQCGMAMARAAEVAVRTAAVVDNPEKETEPTAPAAPVTNNFFLPPVAKPRGDAVNPTAKLGAGDTLPPKAKPPTG